MVNLADLWEGLADALPDADAVAFGGGCRSWRQYEDRAARLAAGFAAHGLGPSDKVALYLYNGPEYVESQFAAFKNRAVPCNVNYRYLAGELEYLLVNADARVVVFDHTLADRVLEVRDRCPELRLLVQVGGDPAGDVVAYEDLIASQEPQERIAMRIPWSLHFKWHRTCQAATKVAGETTPPASVLEWVTAEVLAGLSQPVSGLSVEFVAGQLQTAAACVHRLRELGAYRYNVILGEGRDFHFREWCSADQVITWLEGGAERVSSGDVYARLGAPDA